MPKSVRFLIPCILAVALSAQDRRIAPVAQGPRRLALVIGNNAYRDRPLRNAVNDAQAVKAALEALSFRVDMKLNVTLAQMEAGAEGFVSSVRPGDVALFYYSGHGIQVAEQNYLIPVDFEARTAVDAKYKAYAASRMQENLEAAGVSLQMIVLDACRDNPYRSLRGAGGGGLAAMQVGKGTYIAFATGPGKTADDNAGEGNGLFTGAFVQQLREPGLTLDEVFNRVRARVSAARPEQVPWSTSSVVGEFYFRPGLTEGPRATQGADAEAWEMVRGSSDPRTFEQFLKEYPASPYAGAARLKLATLRPPDTSGTTSAPAAKKINSRDGLMYVWIPPGRFLMGCSPGDKECSDNEKPAHPVTITKGFWMAQTPVTQAAYRRLVGSDRSHFKGDDLPVETLSWNEAKHFCEAGGMRLPTEAEWEYAARAGASGPRYGPIDSIAWYRGNSGSHTHPVGQKAPNAFGLTDMLGNLSEWVADWYGDYDGQEQRDPQGPAIGKPFLDMFRVAGRPPKPDRVVRGTDWTSESAKSIRVSSRIGLAPDFQTNIYIGFRCAGQMP